MALGLSPSSAGTFAAIGYTHHLAVSMCADASAAAARIAVQLMPILAGPCRFTGKLDLFGCDLFCVLPTKPIQGSLEEAIENYHKALGLRPEDSFTADMLTAALQEECIRYSCELVLSET